MPEYLVFLLMVVVFVLLAMAVKLPIGLALAASAVAGMLAGGQGLSLRHLVEGGFGFFDVILIIFTAMVYMKVLQASGILDSVTALDIHEPSSRQCLADLTKKVDTLEAKGIITVALQTSLAGTKEEYALLRAHCPVFPWRPAWEGFEARRAAWGIKSLPWLILADKKHAVVAAGFSLDELDKRMAEAFAR